MIITKKYGSFVFLGEIITDLEIEAEEKHRFEEIRQYKECGECRACYQECPSKSIHEGKIQPNICLSYLTQKKDLTDQEIRLLGSNIFGCDYCQLKCPYNQNAIKNVLKEFETLEYMNEELEQYAAMDNAYFKEKIAQTSCGWRGKNVIRRNAILSLAKQDKEIDVYLGSSPYVNEYVHRAKNLKKL